MDADSKLIVSYMLGEQHTGVAQDVMRDVASRVANRVQVITHGHASYTYAVGDAIKRG